jgi:glutathione S-transferase
VYKFSCLTGIPEMTKGLVRELRVRWTLSEMDLPYEAVCYPHPETKKEEYMQKQPFGQVPYLESEDLSMFETGAILLHLALKHKKLLPADEKERAHVLTWMFAALNTLEPILSHNFMLKIDPDAPESMKIKARDAIDKRLAVFSESLGKKEFFGESFSIADIMIMDKHENLSRYLQRMEARPAFKKALNEHLKLYPEKV